MESRILSLEPTRFFGRHPRAMCSVKRIRCLVLATLEERGINSAQTLRDTRLLQKILRHGYYEVRHDRAAASTT